ncbi:MAG: hypothetical protein LC687_04075 [Actinobacteria bacterium]|nr:hypothetical protein [Actinomycetota bacterium]MCA1807012.1 hypothetical protein [Actinomycetota bacterium]
MARTDSKWKQIGLDAADRISDQIVEACLMIMGLTLQDYREGLTDEQSDRLEELTVELADEVIEGWNMAWFMDVSHK